jgi:hypothetical protein
MHMARNRARFSYDTAFIFCWFDSTNSGVFSVEKVPPSRRYARTAALRLPVQPWGEDEDEDDYFLSFSKQWRAGGMELTGENRSTRGRTCPSDTFSNTNPTQTDPASKPVLRGRRLAANRLRHGTANSGVTSKCISTATAWKGQLTGIRRWAVAEVILESNRHVRRKKTFLGLTLTLSVTKQVVLLNRQRTVDLQYLLFIFCTCNLQIYGGLLWLWQHEALHIAEGSILHVLGTFMPFVKLCNCWQTDSRT